MSLLDDKEGYSRRRGQDEGGGAHLKYSCGPLREIYLKHLYRLTLLQIFKAGRHLNWFFISYQDIVTTVFTAFLFSWTHHKNLKVTWFSRHSLNKRKSSSVQRCAAKRLGRTKQYFLSGEMGVFSSVTLSPSVPPYISFTKLKKESISLSLALNRTMKTFIMV